MAEIVAQVMINEVTLISELVYIFLPIPSLTLPLS